jgi:hypothetical protein
MRRCDAGAIGLNNPIGGTARMNAKVKFKIGDTVYHRTLDLGRGKVRYIYQAELRVAFEKVRANRYPKEELCKSEPHRAPQPDSGDLRAA